MPRAVRIGLIGDRSDEVRAHAAIPRALQLAAAGFGRAVEAAWFPTGALAGEAARKLEPCDGLWCVPGSPYADMEGALQAIRFAREARRPFLGTCGGFQHALLEFARDVLGMGEADHAESNPAAAVPLIGPLACSLAGKEGLVLFEKESRVARIYGRTEVLESYHCRFGLDRRFRSRFEGSGMIFSGQDTSGDVRVVELADHPFFIATLYQPELSALRGATHPLVIAFTRAAAARA
jgi:CTP synthase (UTP-ammonia lyase)